MNMFKTSMNVEKARVVVVMAIVAIPPVVISATAMKDISGHLMAKVARVNFQPFVI